ncbi:MAG TPA: HAD-IIA family hydrolase [Thermodesulfobacteriota bacterium]|nr:HAD-IIA family hydrolase [Thermodesulfobacteriota bacterium]
MNPLLSFGGYIFDLDGTIYLGERLIPGAHETIGKLKSLRKKIVYLSNKPLQTREDYAAKLTRLGIPTEPEEVINSSLVMARWLSAQAPQAFIYVIGEPPLIDEMTRAGFRITEKAGEVQYVIASFDRTFDYRKLNIALQAIKKGARFVATNPDRTCPVEGGEIPDCAAMIGAVEGTTGVKVEAIVGKPSHIMIRVAVDMMALKPGECLLAGDRLETDMVMGKRAGMATALVLTGVTTRSMLESSDIRPDFILESVAEISKVT